MTTISSMFDKHFEFIVIEKPMHSNRISFLFVWFIFCIYVQKILGYNFEIVFQIKVNIYLRLQYVIIYALLLRQRDRHTIKPTFVSILFNEYGFFDFFCMIFGNTFSKCVQYHVDIGFRFRDKRGCPNGDDCIMPPNMQDECSWFMCFGWKKRMKILVLLKGI